MSWDGPFTAPAWGLSLEPVPQGNQSEVIPRQTWECMAAFKGPADEVLFRSDAAVGWRTPGVQGSMAPSKPQPLLSPATGAWLEVKSRVARAFRFPEDAEKPKFYINLPVFMFMLITH